MAIEIKSYEDWMKPQVAALFSMQYAIPESDFANLMDNFYDHPYQKEICIRVVAVDGEKVVGFQSFFYWPYLFEGKTLRSFQSGNSLVHPDYRGKGIFQKLLDFLDQHREKIGIDFLVGFPVLASKNSFLKNNWKNIFDLQWYAKPVNVFAFLFGNEEKKLARIFTTVPGEKIKQPVVSSFRLSDDAAFLDWRKNYSKHQHYFYYRFSKDGNTLEFALKTSRRKKIIRELTIGDIKSSSYDPAFIQAGLKDLAKKVRSSGCITILSCAKNPADGLLSEATMTEAGYRMLSNKIFFIVKPFSDFPAVTDPSKWIVFRSDIDTW